MEKVIFVGVKHFEFFSNELLGSIDIVILTDYISIVPLSLQPRSQIILIKREYDPVSLTYSLRVDDCIKALHPHIDQNQNVRVFCNQESDLIVAENIRLHFQLYSHITGSFDRFRNKDLMKTIVKNKGLRVPNFITFDKSCLPKYHVIQKKLGETSIAKPLSSVGSRAISKIENEQDYEAFIRDNYAMLEHFEIEEFIDGTLYQYDFAIRNGDILYSTVSQYSCPLALLQKGYTFASIKVKNPSWEYNTISTFGRKCAQALSANNGCFHMEVFISANQSEIVFLEIAARSPGVLTVPAYVNWDGFNMYDAELMIQANLSSMPETPSNWVSSPSFLVIIPKMDGVVKEIRQPTTLGLFDIDWKIKPDDKIDGTQTNIDNAGTALVICNTEDEARIDFKHITENYTPVIYY